MLSSKQARRARRLLPADSTSRRLFGVPLPVQSFVLVAAPSAAHRWRLESAPLQEAAMPRPETLLRIDPVAARAALLIASTLILGHLAAWYSLSKHRR